MLSRAMPKELRGLWFGKHQFWFPILHQSSLLGVLETAPRLEKTIKYMVLKVIASVMVPHSSQLNVLTQDKRRQSSDNLRS